MEQHPIPQNISSYQFRLVGDMTLKQFFQLAGGILVGLIFYSLPLLAIIRWPLAIISVILGIGLAFFPLEERPLEKWIFAFFKSIYSPTIFYWQKTDTPKKFFQDEDVASQITASPEQEEALKKYLATQPVPNSPLTSLDQAEKGFLAKMSGMLSAISMPTISSQNTVTSQTATQPENQKTELTIPEQTPIKVTPQQQMPKLVVEEKPVIPVVNNTITTQVVAPIIAGNEVISTRQALFSVDAAPPSPPTVPNVVVGQVVNQDRKIIEGAIMEIRDSAGRPVRALRSNKAGHFIIVTPLDQGKYDIVTEKEGFSFTPVFFEANGQLIPPILIRGIKTESGIQNAEFGTK